MARKSSKKSASKSAPKPGSKAPPKSAQRIPPKTAPKTALTSAAKSRAPASPKTVKKSAKPTASASAAASLREGDRAPDFTLKRDGDSTVRLADFGGRKLVIFFYPRADTPGCTLEAIDFTRHAKQFEQAGTGLLGISADDVGAQTKFRDKHGLGVPLGADADLTAIKAYGVWGEKSMYGKTFLGIIRTTVLVGSDGKVARIWRNVKVNGHAADVLQAAKAL
jgi:thioredoxin-dependent peroxiredoxin